MIVRLLTFKEGAAWLVIVNPSQSYGASPAIWDHTVLTDTQQYAGEHVLL